MWAGGLNGICGRAWVGLRAFVTRGSAPREFRARLVAPLFDRPASLFLAHATYVLLSLIATVQFHMQGGEWLLSANLVLLGVRVHQVWRARRLRLAGCDYTRASDVARYMAAGLVFNALAGLFACLATLHHENEELRILALTVALAGSAGVAARNSGTPRFATMQILVWLLPESYAAMAYGAWHRLLAVLVLLFVYALISIVWRSYSEILGSLTAELNNASLSGRLDATLSTMSEGLLLYDSAGSLQMINRRFFTLLGLPQDCVRVGQTASALSECCRRAGIIVHEERRGTNSPSSSERTDAATQPGVLLLTDGRTIAVSREKLANSGMVCTYEDITDRQRSEATIAHMAQHDALTELPNRVMFQARLDREVADLENGNHFVVACLDLDHFKTVNDTLGHGTGDRLLQSVTGRLQGAMRQFDLVARLGGDEFAILMMGVSDPAEAELIAARLIATISAPYDIDGCAVAIGVSIGLALAPRDGSTAESLMMYADLAMYAAKEDGRGKIKRFKPDLSQRLAARRNLEHDFRAALERQEFEMFYQPIVSLCDDRVAGFEALVRWNHPERGRVPPDEFIPFAEESGLIVQLGDWVLATACREAATWSPDLMVAINLSPVQFRTGKVLQSVLSALEMSGLPPARLEVEITEAAVLGDTEATLQALRHLRKIGARVAFDDFGTGFSSLSYLQRFPFDKIKIDKSFIADLTTSDSASAIVRAITGLGSSLRLSTTAEGVETEQQLTALQDLGCSQAQGYLFSRPCPANELPALLRKLAGRKKMPYRLHHVTVAPPFGESRLASKDALLA